MSDDQGNEIDWIVAENDEPGVGDCSFVACANVRLKITGVRMSDGEILNGYSVIAGWRPMDITTNHGAAVTRVLDYWRDMGWPSDPEDKIAGWSELTTDELRAAVERDGACLCWVMLPTVDGDWCFDDRALGSDGVAAHAMAIVGADDDGITVVTWGEERRASWDWAREFMRGAYAVRFEASAS